MHFSHILTLVTASLALAAPAPGGDTRDLTSRADSSLVGYLGVFFLGQAPSVYFYLSNGNNALSFKALNAGGAVLDPSSGTGGVRDPSIIKGGGDEAGKKWYIIGTDLDIAKACFTTWPESQRHGSLSIYIWESTDLINWGTERLVKVEDDDAGMVWAPDAIWDASKGQYLVHWASKFYSSSDPDHTGTPGQSIIRYAHTSDFKTFTSPQTLIDRTPASIIDLAILPVGTGSYIRFIKNETASYVFSERSESGLFGTWTRPSDASTIRTRVEGPYTYADNVAEGTAHLLLDYYTSDGYRPFTSTDLSADNWVDADRSEFPANLRHGSVIGIAQEQYDTLNEKWG